MARDGLDEQQAEARALSTLRLVAARRAELASREQPPTYPDELDPRSPRATRARRAGAPVARPEPSKPRTRPTTFRSGSSSRTSPTPRSAVACFTPELYFVCQGAARAGGEVRQPPRRTTERRRSGAAVAHRRRAAFAPFVARVRSSAPDLLATDDCSLLERFVQRLGAYLTAHGPDGGRDRSRAVTLRFEQFAFAPSEATTFDPGWVATVLDGAARAGEPSGRSLIGPFATRFGLHLVVVGKIEAGSARGRLAAPAQLQAARGRRCATRSSKPGAPINFSSCSPKFRDRRVVRLSPSSSGSSEPCPTTTTRPTPSTDSRRRIRGL